MKKRTVRKLTCGIIMSLIIQSLPTFSIGEAQILTSFQEVPVQAADGDTGATGTPGGTEGTGTPDAPGTSPGAETTGTPATPGTSPSPEAGTPTTAPSPTAGPSATTAPSPTPTEKPTFYMVDSTSNKIPEGELLDITSSVTTIGIHCSLGYFPSDAKITWQPYDHNIIELKENLEDGKYTVTLDSVGPGYSTLSAQITYDGRDYLLHCQLHVPLLLKNQTNTINHNNGNAVGENLGMIDSVKWGETENKKTLQLTVPQGDNYTEYSHYIPMFEYIQYADGLNSSSPDTYNGGRLMEKLPALKWSSSNPLVATVDQYGYIKTVGSGTATIRVETTTLDNSHRPDYKEFTLVVAPMAYQQGGDNTTFQEKLDIRVAATDVTFITNAVQSTELIWELYKDSPDSKGEKLDLEKNDYLKVNISNVGNGVSLSEMKAGIYYLLAKPSKDFEMNNPKIHHLEICIFVPILVSLNPIVMNVNDFYDVLRSANIPSKDIFRYAIEDGQGHESDIAEISAGVVTAKQEGGGVIRLYYDIEKDIYKLKETGYDDPTLEKMFGTKPQTDKDSSGEIRAIYYEIDLRVIDGISMNTTMTTMYVGATLQLRLNTSNNIVGITWASEDESIAKVDDDGLVTAIAAGTVVITATQVIHGVTKRATCRVRVVDTVTSITLDPTSKELGIGDLLTINAKVEPKLNTISLHWVSSDTSVITIEQAGDLSATVKAVAGGTAVVSAINQDNIVVGSCLIKVHQPITAITLSQTKVTVPLSSKQFQLFATVKPEEAKNEELVWKTTDPAIATVDAFGMVTLKKTGTVSIICSSKEDGNISAICNVTITKSVSGIKLDQTELNMFVGETYRLTYVITPADASDVAVTWTTTNKSVVTVDAKGLVSAKGVGQASVILKTADGGFMAICSINVGRTATAVKLDVNELTLNVGDYYYFETTITPADSTDTTLIWETSNKSVAIISNKGKITAKEAGVTVIMAKTKSGSTAYCTVTVQQGVTEIELSSAEEVIEVDETIELTAKISPKDATVQDVTWESSNKKVAKVDEEGEVTGLSEGVALITCTTEDGGYVDYCVIIVEPKEVLMEKLVIIPEEYKLGVGKRFQLETQITPETTTNKKLSWSSSDEDIVTVDQKGRIRGISVGEAVITCEATDDSETVAYCEVEVCYQIDDIYLNYEYLDLVEGESAQLTATLNPENASYGVIWETLDDEVAIVNRTTGKVTALKEGKTQITATANDSGKVTAICYVNVRKPVATKSISVSESEIVMIPGESQTVSFTILPATHTDKYTWSSDNPAVASVNIHSGLISAHMMGTANINIMADSGAKATIKVYVVGLSKSNLTLQQYSSTLISLEVYGASKSDLQVKWYSDNERIAEVQGGKITARALGSTTVYAVVNGRTLPCKVKVEKIRN